MNNNKIQPTMKLNAHWFPFHILDSDDCEQCTRILEELENIDDDCDRHGITFVKTKDFSVAEAYGVNDYPALVYFESSIPNVFEGMTAIEFKRTENIF